MSNKGQSSEERDRLMGSIVKIDPFYKNSDLAVFTTAELIALHARLLKHSKEKGKGK